MLWTLCDGHGGNGPSNADDDLKPEAWDECRAGCLDHGTDGDPDDPGKSDRWKDGRSF